MLKIAHPGENWESGLFRRGLNKATQRWLRETVQVLFPGEELVEEVFAKDLMLTKEAENMNISFDLFLPRLRLAFEFQGNQHFEDYFVETKSSEREGTSFSLKSLKYFH